MRYKGSIVLLLVCLGKAYAGDHTITLTPAQETSLLFRTETINNERIGGTDTAGKPLLTFTPEQVLTMFVDKYLLEQQRLIDARLENMLPTIKALDTATLEKVLQASPASPALKMRLQERLQ